MDRVSALRAILCSYNYRNIVDSAGKRYIAVSAYRCLGIDYRCADRYIGYRMVYDQIVGVGITVKGRR